MNMKTKRRHKHIKLLKITRQEAERMEIEWFRRYNYKLNTIING
jgi:hypothetical protein